MTNSCGIALFTFLLTCQAQAQTVTLNASDMLPAGSTYTLRSLGNITALDTSSGTGVVWSNGAIPLLTTTETVSVLAPGNTPHGGSFPTSNYCLYESVISRWSYFTLNADSMARRGFFIQGTLGTYSDPQVELVFPLTVGSTNTDTWANNTVSFPGTYSYRVLGSGTLQIPGGSFQNALLLRVDVVNLFPMRQYLWISGNNGAILLLYTAANFLGPASGQVIGALNVGLEESVANIDIRVHPMNGNVLPVTYTSADRSDYRIMDLTGRTLATGSLPAAPSAVTEFLSMPHPATGVHLLELSNGRSRGVVRFLAEHR